VIDRPWMRLPMAAVPFLFRVDIAGFPKSTIHTRLNVLVAVGHVEKIHSSGLYELIDDPRRD